MSRFFSEKFRALIPYTPGEQPKQRKYVKLNTNESPFPPSPFAQRMARQAAGDLQLYPDPECRDLIAMAAKQLGLESRELMFTNGSDDALNFTFAAFCDETHPAVFPDITYGFYPVFAAYNHVPYQEIPLQEDLTIRVEDYVGIGKNIYLANPNALTGIALSRTDIERIVASNPDNVVVVDEAYVDFGAESVLPLIRSYDNLIVIQTLSKSRSLAGARLGFAAACPELIADLNTLRYSTNPYNINRMTMAAGVGALCDADYFDKNCRTIAETREQTAEALNKMGFLQTPSKANFLFARYPGRSGSELYEQLREKGILVRHFSLERVKDYLRITIGSKEEMAQLLRALEELL